MNSKDTYTHVQVHTSRPLNTVKFTRTLFLLVLSIFTIFFYSCGDGLFGSDDVVIKTFDAESWVDTGNRYPGKGRSVFRTPEDADGEGYYYKVSLEKGGSLYEKEIPEGTIVEMSNIPVGTWKVTCRAYHADGSIVAMGSAEALIEAGVTTSVEVELKNCPVVTFILDADGNSYSQTVEFGGRVTKPETPTKSGFVFAGWYKVGNTADNGTEFDFATEINEDLTLIARWEEFQGTAYREVELPYGTAGTAYTYVEFGDWPQTIIASDVTVDEKISVEVGMFTYYKGNDGAWYAKIKENACQRGDKYTNGDYVALSGADSYRYFKVEPIKWRILTDNYSGKRLLLAENIIVNCAYYDYYNVNRDGPIYPNNYKESRIRAYLNGLSYNVKPSSDEAQIENDEFVGRGFFQTAFTESLRSIIADDTTIDNSAASTTDAGENLHQATDYVCVNTTDRIFLLSEKEVTTEGYGFAAIDKYLGDSNETTESSRIRMTTDFAKASGAYQNTTAGYGGNWWLRSPYDFTSDRAHTVTFYGHADSVEDVRQKNGGVVPALTLKN